MQAKKIFGIVVGVLVVVWALAWWSSQMSINDQLTVNQVPTAGLEQVGVSVVINNGQTTVTYPLTLSQSSTVLEALQSIEGLPVVTKDYGQLGVLVTGIGEQLNGQGDRYWQYWLNGGYSLIGADKQVLKANDTVEWKFLTEQSRDNN